jgi:hypothetical protein
MKMIHFPEKGLTTTANGSFLSTMSFPGIRKGIPHATECPAGADFTASAMVADTMVELICEVLKFPVNSRGSKSGEEGPSLSIFGSFLNSSIPGSFFELAASVPLSPIFARADREVPDIRVVVVRVFKNFLLDFPGYVMVYFLVLNDKVKAN